MGTLDAAVGSLGICGSPRAGRCCSNWRMLLRVFCWALACSLASKSPDSSLMTRSSVSKAIGFQFSSMMMGCSGEEEGVLGAEMHTTLSPQGREYSTVRATLQSEEITQV